MRYLVIILLFCVLPGADSGPAVPMEHTPVAYADLNRISEQLLENIMAGRDTEDLRDQLARATLRELQEGLRTDAQKLAFWVNVYNGYIQVILRQHPEYYKDRSEFFKREQIPIAGETISFAKIEHGIIRRSQWELGRGRISKWFPDTFERMLRVERRDYRIHFALNCGARDCPPIAIYTPKGLNEQFSDGTRQYLQRTSEYSAGAGEVAVTTLFNWFRGDFGGTDGIKGILKEYGIIPETENIRLTYKNYDWTLQLNNFKE